MKWADVKSLTIPEGVVSKVTSAGAAIWQKAAKVMQWTQSNVTDREFNSVACGNGVWVAAGGKHSSEGTGLYWSDFKAEADA